MRLHCQIPIDYAHGHIEGLLPHLESKVELSKPVYEECSHAFSNFLTFMIHKTLWQLECFLFIEQVLCDFGSELSHRLHFAKIEQVANFKLSIERFGSFATSLFHSGSYLGQSGQTKHRLLFALTRTQLFLPCGISLSLFLTGYSCIGCGEIHEFLLSSGAHIMRRISKRHSQRIRAIWTGQIWIICIIMIRPLILIRLLIVFTTIFQIGRATIVIILRRCTDVVRVIALLFLALTGWGFGCPWSLRRLAG